jgi:protein tyrosine/serine phosphatase
LYLQDIQVNPDCLYAYFEINDLLKTFWDENAWKKAAKIIEGILKEFPEHEDSAEVLKRIKRHLAKKEELLKKFNEGGGHYVFKKSHGK